MHARGPWPRHCLVPCAVLTLACAGGRPADASPVETVRHFLEVMDRSASDAEALREAYRLLDAKAQSALARRAERARTLSGQAYEPWDMLAQGRFRLRFAPASPRGMQERIDGERALVTVRGAKAGEQARVPLVRERGRWRIALVIPAMRSDAHKSDG